MKEYRIDKSEEIPEIESSGVICFHDEQDKLIYVRMTGNISAFLKRYFENDIEDKNLGELISLTSKCMYQETDSIFEAMVMEKTLKAEHLPSFNRTYRDYDQYRYLGLNFLKYPFIKMEDTTINDNFYIGPFRDPYLVRDSIDILSRVFGTPVCSAMEMPCYLMENGQCKGYCVQNQEELARDLTACYLIPDQSILGEIEEQKQLFSSQLKFKEAEELLNYHRILQRFYAQITFLAVTKWLDLVFEFNGIKYEIEKGLLKKAGKMRFPVLNGDFQPNELYAVDKSELDERWVIFNQIKNQFPQALIEAYDNTRKMLTSYLTNKENT